MQRRFASTVVACLLVVLFALVAYAAVPAPSAPALRAAELPADSQADADAIIAGRQDAAFIPLPDTELESSTGGNRWFRLQLDTDWNSPELPVLSIRDAGYTRVHLYAPPEHAEHMLWHEKPDPQARFSRHALAFALPATLRAGQSVYLMFEHTLTRTRPRAVLVDMATYQSIDLRHVRTITLFGSVQFVMLLVGLSLWFALRDRVFLYFVIYAGFQLVYELMVSGELYDLPTGTLFSLLGQRGAWLFAVLSGAFAITFILEFCNLRRHTPRLAKVLGATRWLYAVAAVLVMVPARAFAPLLQTALNLVFLLSALIAIGAVARATWRGNRASRFFLVAWMPQVVFTVFRTTQLLLAVPVPPWLEYGYPFTMAFASIVITLGLADAILHARRERDIAHGLAERDGLTGALNRRALMARLASAMADARATAGSFALLFLDIDHFKTINDRHGHLAGDHCLKAVADTIAATMKGSQYFGRYGGEEFLVLLPGASHAEALTIGERLRHRIEGLTIASEGRQLHLTASIGIACLADDIDSAEQLISCADQALYRAKADGRNRVGLHAHPLAAASL